MFRIFRVHPPPIDKNTRYLTEFLKKLNLEHDMEPGSLSQSDLAALTKFDTPTICNVIELFDIRPRNSGYMDQRIQACFPEMGPIVGYAATATFRSSSPAPGSDGYDNIEVQVKRFHELSGPPIVVFQDLDDPAVAATFGEIMCTTYKTFGAVGLITSGAGRDLDQVRRLGFPVFTNGTISAHGYCHAPDIHVPVRVGGVMVIPDDLLHADLNGVTTIPKEIASEVAQVGQAFVAAEAVILDGLRGFGPDPKKLHEARLESKRQINELRSRVSRKQ
jgi:4-hydroxy-4-methyl-2-oxoglutarate aldolase